MKLLMMVLAIGSGACGKDEPRPPMEAPKLSAAGDVVVPKGNETTFVFDGTPTRLEYSWIEVLRYENKPAIRIFARGGPKHGTFTMTAVIPEGTQTFAQMKGATVGASEVSFGNTPDMATGTGATIWIDEVAADHVSGRFEAQACPHGQRTCANPKDIKKGTFRAFRSALSDDETFTRYINLK